MLMRRTLASLLLTCLAIPAQGNAQAVPDGGFEQVQVGAGKYVGHPSGTPWTFTGSSGHLRQLQRLHAGQPGCASR